MCAVWRRAANVGRQASDEVRSHAPLFAQGFTKAGNIDAREIGQPGADHRNADSATQVTHQVEQAGRVSELRLCETR